MPSNSTSTQDIVPSVALGSRFAALSFSPGRYAIAVQRTLHGTHELQVLDEDSTSSLTIDLANDGAATACRGWRYEFHNAGPDVNTVERYREQQGYRGRYTVTAGVAEVTLTADTSVCAHVFEGELVLARAPSLRLRCVLARPSSGIATPGPVLLCQPGAPRPAELDPYVIESLGPADWLLLGSGNGIRVRVTGRPPGAQAGDDVAAAVTSADAPLGADAWQQRF